MGTPVLTEDQYMELDGAVCPFCSSHNFHIVPDPQLLERSDTYLCKGCDESWREHSYHDLGTKIITGFTPV
jgi:hypothetical protein